MKRVAVFGGSFNPPHVGHVLGAVYVMSMGEVDALLVVPVYAHPFLKQLAPYEDRVKMCELAMAWIPAVEVSRIEAELEAPSLTLRTLGALAERHPNWQLRLVIGADVLTESDKWHAWDEVVKLAPPLVLGRVGVTGHDAPPPVLPDISSTRARELLASPGGADELRAAVPARVLDYARERRLYAG